LQGVLVEAKNGDKLYRKKKLHAANGKAQIAFMVPWGGGGAGAGNFVHFSLVPNVFPLSSQWVLTCSQYVPQIRNVFLNIFSIAPHFYPICFGTCSPLFTYIGGPKGRNIYFKIELSVLGSLNSFIFLSDGPIKLPFG
jgi:hypothetical protein